MGFLRGEATGAVELRFRLPKIHEVEFVRASKPLNDPRCNDRLRRIQGACRKVIPAMPDRNISVRYYCIEDRPSVHQLVLTQARSGFYEAQKLSENHRTE